MQSILSCVASRVSKCDLCPSLKLHALPQLGGIGWRRCNHWRDTNRPLAATPRPPSLVKNPTRAWPFLHSRTCYVAPYALPQEVCAAHSAARAISRHPHKLLPAPENVATASVARASRTHLRAP